MNSIVSTQRAAAQSRIIGRHQGEQPGPKLIVVCGIHGNEPGGVIAARDLLDRLAQRRFPFRGELVVVLGNVRAFAQGQRYLSRDLNRLWTADQLGLAREPSVQFEAGDERLEQRELLSAIDAEFDSAQGPVFFVDLHTTSAAGFPFLVIGDTLRHREFASRFPLTVLIGLEEAVDGVLLEYMTEQGAITLGVEGGQHDAPASVAALRAVLWLSLAYAGLVPETALPERAEALAELDRARGNLPRVIEVLARYAIRPEDEFVMEPGFANIAPVEKNQLLARDRSGIIFAPRRGLVLLPLYQGKGEDGFFFGRAMPNWWLFFSGLLRRTRLDLVLPFLPGVRRDKLQPDRLIVDTRVARVLSREIFRTFGFRKVRDRGDVVVFARRKQFS